jgi:RNA polymerase sigma-70 factor (ECF subfamily)
MDEAGRTALEEDARARCAAGDFDGAATRAIKGYGPEIFGFLLALHRDEQDAGEVFSIFTENLWKGLRGFSWTCTLRAWAYTVARHASYRHSKNARRDAKRHAPLEGASEAGVLAVKVRTETLTYLKTEQKDRFAELRASLPADDQTLLLLRVDRKLAWEDLARIMLSEEAGPLDEALLKKESARLRKRFQLVKEKLLEMGREAGLVKKNEA